VKSILVDTGVLYALADREDRWHEKCKIFLEKNSDALIAPVTVLPEICYFLNRNLGASAEIEFVKSCLEREIEVENITESDLKRALDFMEEHRHSRIGFVDASIAAVGERLKITRVLTIDRRHFSLFRPKHCSHFTLLP